MKKLLVIGIVLFASSVMASPFLVSDPPLSGETKPNLYKITGPGWVPPLCGVEPDGSLKADVAGSPVGTTQLTVTACNNDPVWGESCSDPVPFTYTRPQQPAITKSIRLIP
jgi:hypothetical protein